MRYKIKFPDLATFRRAIPRLTTLPGFVSSEAGRFASVLAAPFEADVLEQLRRVAAALGAVVTKDFQYDPEAGDISETVDPIRLIVAAGVEMLGILRLPQQFRGAGTTLAIADNGVDAEGADISEARLVEWWPATDPRPWKAPGSHGTQVAAVAAAIAARAGVIACRTDYCDSELAAFYDEVLTPRAARGEKIVAVNSWGWKSTTEPVLPPQSEMRRALDRAVANGVLVVFSAGNNHPPNSPNACAPPTIWHFKNRADVIAVGSWNPTTTDVWRTSSRGRGTISTTPRRMKPDLVAPVMQLGGTSFACPEAAGVAALVWSANLSLHNSDVHEMLCATALDHTYVTDECEGCGLIAAADAVTGAQRSTAPTR